MIYLIEQPANLGSKSAGSPICWRVVRAWQSRGIWTRFGCQVGGRSTANDAELLARYATFF